VPIGSSLTIVNDDGTVVHHVNTRNKSACDLCRSQQHRWRKGLSFKAGLAFASASPFQAHNARPCEFVRELLAAIHQKHPHRRIQETVVAEALSPLEMNHFGSYLGRSSGFEVS
jgi:hypothetical protein